MAGESVEVETGAAFELLANDRRRRLLRLLQGRESPVSVSTLAEELVALEREAAAAESTEGVGAVGASLHHVHLPKLEDAGVVQFSPNPGRVELVGDDDTVAALLDAVDGRDEASG